jgi:hypothetical protein
VTRSPKVSTATQSEALGQAIESPAPTGPSPLVSFHRDGPPAGSVEVRRSPLPSTAAQKLGVGHDTEVTNWPGSRPTRTCQSRAPPLGSVEVRTSFEVGWASEFEPTATQNDAVGHETSAGTPRSVPGALIGRGGLQLGAVATSTALACLLVAPRVECRDKAGVT